eukprot:scaffold603_cov404-Prasinococcus_capsulatus_cf.AAC.16
MVLRERGLAFVPLAGKTVDMLYLATLGQTVVGVELSQVSDWRNLPPLLRPRNLEMGAIHFRFTLETRSLKGFTSSSL